MNQFEDVYRKLLTLNKEEIVLYIAIKETPAPLMTLGKRYPDLNVAESAAALLKNGLIVFRGEEVYPK